MSHFTVLVVGPDVEKQLAPFHEFECTGRDDEFVQSVDLLPKLREQYVQEDATTRRLRDTAGVLHHPYEDRFYRDPTDEEVAKHGNMNGSAGYVGGLSYVSKDWGDGRGSRAKVQYVPEGYEEIQCTKASIMSFLEFVQDEHEYKILTRGHAPSEEHKYGWITLNEAGEVAAVIDRTNPNAKWDWFVIGGRWTGFFPLKPGAKALTEHPPHKSYIEPTERREIDEARRGAADSCLWGDVDIERKKTKARENARGAFERWMRHAKDKPEALAWSWFVEKIESHAMSAETARVQYGEQPAIAAYRSDRESLWECPVDTFGMGLEAYQEKCSRGTLAPFAFLIDGKWIERGEMGWWGAVADEKSEEDWGSTVERIFATFTPETVVTIVDCHI